MQKIGLVTVLYKSDDVLEDFFASIALQTFSNYILYLVDNSHNERSDELIRQYLVKQHISDHRHIKSETNAGVAAGNNIGIQAALKDDCSHVLILNNDIVIEDKDAFTKMMELAATEKIITPKILFFDTRKIWTAGGRMDTFRGLGVAYGMHEEDKGQYDKARYVTSESTCFMLVNKEVFASVGLMDEQYFVYVDDTDFVYRATKKGFRVLYTPSIVILHKVSSSTGGTQTPFYVYYSNRNKIYFVRKNFKGLHKFFSLSYVLISRIFFYLKYKKDMRKSLVKAVKDGMRLKY